MRYSILALVFFCSFAPALQWQDPTEGKPFLPWLWQDQFQPTITMSLDKTGMAILAGGGLTSIGTHQYDYDVVEHNLRGKHLLMDEDTSKIFGTIGGGGLGIGIVLGQLFFDQGNGLMHARSMALTAASHATLAFAVQRKRPNNRGDYLPFPSSYPSGHVSSAFSTAGSLAYAYGWKVGVPAYLVATSIGVARVSENAHWLSDVTTGAAIGIYWARASYKALASGSPPPSSNTSNFMPVPLEKGLALSYSMEF